MEHSWFGNGDMKNENQRKKTTPLRENGGTSEPPRPHDLVSTGRGHSSQLWENNSQGDAWNAVTGAGTRDLTGP